MWFKPICPLEDMGFDYCLIAEHHFSNYGNSPAPLLATNTGWSLRHPDMGGRGQILGNLGSTVAFPVTRSQRESSGDSRLSLEERYSSKEDYLSQVRLAAETLVKEGYLLASGIEGVVDQAAQRYEMLQSAVGQPQAADD